MVNVMLSRFSALLAANTFRRLEIFYHLTAETLVAERAPVVTTDVASSVGLLLALVTLPAIVPVASWPISVRLGVGTVVDTWTIFSAQEISHFLDLPRSIGLHPVGAVNPTAATPIIPHDGKDYTFAWMGLKKATPA